MWGRIHRGENRHRQVRSRSFGRLRCSLRGPAEHTVLDLEGELDFAVDPEFAALVRALPQRIVAIDLSELEFIDAEGVALVTALARELGERAGLDEPAMITGASGPIERTFDLVEGACLTLA